MIYKKRRKAILATKVIFCCGANPSSFFNRFFVDLAVEYCLIKDCQSNNSCICYKFGLAAAFLSSLYGPKIVYVAAWVAVLTKNWPNSGKNFLHFGRNRGKKRLQFAHLGKNSHFACRNKAAWAHKCFTWNIKATLSVALLMSLIYVAIIAAILLYMIAAANFDISHLCLRLCGSYSHSCWLRVYH